MTPGLANKLAMPFVTKVCTTFPETAKQLSADKAVHIGPVIRQELLEGEAKKGRQATGLTADKPVMLIMGGSLGAETINDSVRQNLQTLLNDFQIVHLCGKGHKREDIQATGYCQFEYINEGLTDILAMTDFVVSRAGSNSIFEFLLLHIPMLLIPLSGAQSRGDQLLNAASFETAGYAKVLTQDKLTQTTFLQNVYDVYQQRQTYRDNMKTHTASHTRQQMISLIEQTAR